MVDASIWQQLLNINYINWCSATY